MIRAARVARHAGIPVVADLENDQDPKFGQLLALVDHLIVSQDFAAKLTGQSDPAEAVRRLWTPQRKVAAVTFGDEGCWFVAGDEQHPSVPSPSGRGQGEGRHPPPAPAPRRHAISRRFRSTLWIPPAAATCFTGRMPRRWPGGSTWRARIEFASAAAALKATKPGGQLGIPTRPAVEEFLSSKSNRLVGPTGRGTMNVGEEAMANPSRVADDLATVEEFCQRSGGVRRGDPGRCRVDPGSESGSTLRVNLVGSTLDT